MEVLYQKTSSRSLEGRCRVFSFRDKVDNQYNNVSLLHDKNRKREDNQRKQFNEKRENQAVHLESKPSTCYVVGIFSTRLCSVTLKN